MSPDLLHSNFLRGLRDDPNNGCEVDYLDLQSRTSNYSGLKHVIKRSRRTKRTEDAFKLRIFTNGIVEL